ncbi:hypothetical protein D4R51_01230 [bacterium]|nr:MAG: hypothetical protein D4R51_01230 [bacterium]
MFFSFWLETVPCNKSAIRFCAVDLSERTKGAVKSVIGLRMHQECYSKQRTSLLRKFFVLSQIYPK